jgi:hypothetical protein
MAAYQITETYTGFSTSPNKKMEDSVFEGAMDTRFAEEVTHYTEGNTIIDQQNALSTAVNGYATDAETAKTAAETAQAYATAIANAVSWESVETEGICADSGIIFNGMIYITTALAGPYESPATHPLKYNCITVRHPSVEVVTASETLISADVDGTVTSKNTGATAAVSLTWPTLESGQSKTIVVDAAQYFGFTAPSGVTIRWRDTESISGGGIRSNTVGNTLELTAISTTELIVTNMTGSWEIETT